MIKPAGELIDTIRKLPSEQVYALVVFSLFLIGFGFWFGTTISSFKVDKAEVRAAHAESQLEQILKGESSILEPGFQRIEEHVAVEIPANSIQLKVPIPDSFEATDYVSHFVINSGSGFMRMEDTFKIEGENLVFFISTPPATNGDNVFHILFAKKTSTAGRNAKL